MEAQLDYHEKCTEVLLQIRNEWPSRHSQTPTLNGRRIGRARSNTAHSFQDRCEPLQEELTNGTDQRPIIRSNRSPSSHFAESRETYAPDTPPQRPILNRITTFEGPTQLRQEHSSASPHWPSRTASENAITRRNSIQNRSIPRVPADPHMDYPGEFRSQNGTSPERLYYGRSESPASSYGGEVSRRASSTTLNNAGLHKKAPPPPPPSRAKKPAPPPPPMKKTILSAGEA
ncbi:hypothetical protein EYZ11_004994 [Aspergillus tanneri]|nr:hypothetical protein EYZ11_004994 [Aspergillus tanneri]